MHELSLAQEIIDIVEKSLPRKEDVDVKSVKLKLGKLSNVLPESLIFCFNAIKNESSLLNTSLDIKIIPLTAECTACKKISDIEPPFFYCQNCGSFDVDVRGGTEIDFEEIEIN